MTIGQRVTRALLTSMVLAAVAGCREESVVSERTAPEHSVQTNLVPCPHCGLARLINTESEGGESGWTDHQIRRWFGPPIPGAWALRLSGLRSRSIACFAEGTPQDVVEFHERAMWAELGPLAYFLAGRWSGSQGGPRVITWSFAPDGVSIPSGVGEPVANSELFSRMDALFGSRALWISKFQECFDRWSQLTGITYTHITFSGNDWDDGAGWGSGGSADRGDVRISMKNIDGAFNILAYNNFPASGGDMVIDRSESWASSANNYLFFRNTVMHEHGHGIGLFHVCPVTNTKLLEPFLSTAFDGPQHDEVRAGQRHYGDPFEPDNTAAEATDLGVLSAETLLNVGTVPPPSLGANTTLLSIDADAEQDWFRFNLAVRGDLTITVTPKGLNYDSSPQQGSNCTSGNFVNSLSVANLSLELIDSGGVTVLASAVSNPIGMPEVLSYAAESTGDYYVRVFESPTHGPTESQLYELTIQFATCSASRMITNCFDGQFCNGNEFCDNGNCRAGTPPCGDLGCSNAIASCVARQPGGEPDGEMKNRWISFSPDNGSGNTGYRVEMTASTKFPGSVGVVGWVGTPIAAAGEFYARVVDEANAHFSATWPPVVHVGDCEIVPAATYQLRGMLQGANSSVAANFSAPRSLNTVPEPFPKKWGDVAGQFFFVSWTPPDGICNFNDVVAALERFTGDPEAPHVTWVDVHDEVPNFLLNITDVFLIVKAFQGNEYPFTDPGACP